MSLMKKVNGTLKRKVSEVEGWGMASMMMQRIGANRSEHAFIKIYMYVCLLV